MMKSYGNSIGVATGYRLDDGGVAIIVPVGPRIFANLYSSDRLRDAPSLLSNGYRGLFLARIKL
jgi:hypothetical protein